MVPRETLLLFLLVSIVSGLQTPMENLVSGSQLRETKNVDPSLIEQLQHKISLQLIQYKADFDGRLTKLERICQQSSVIETVVPEDEDLKLSRMEETFVDQMLRFSEKTVEAVEKKIVNAMNDSLIMIDDKLQPLQNDIDNLKTQMSKLVTQDEVDNLQEKLTVLGSEVTAQIKEANNISATEELESFKNNMDDILLAVTYVAGNLTTCNYQEKIQKVLDKMVESDDVLEKLFSYLTEAGENNSQCESSIQNIIDNVDGLRETLVKQSNSISSLEVTIKDTKEDVSSNLEELEKMAKTLAEVQPNPTITAPITEIKTTTAEPSPCLDSKFVGVGSSLEICKSAVRFGKCYLDFVAFHCCKSCFNAGALTSIPRYTASRRVPVLQAMRYMRPT